MLVAKSLEQISLKKNRVRVENSIRKWIVRLLAAPILFVACASGRGVNVPNCPPPSPKVVLELSEIMTPTIDGRYDNLVLWVSEIERYCAALKNSRQ